MKLTMKDYETMKLIIFVLLIIVEVFGGEKEDAINLIKKKFEEYETQSKNLMDTIRLESEKTDKDQERQTTDELNKSVQNAITEFETNVKENAKTAIAKGKPLTAIECLVKVDLEGKQLIKETKEGFTKAIPEVLINKREKLYFASLESQLIKTAVIDLKDATLKKLEETNAPLETLKNDILKKFDLARKQLSEIEVQVPKPVLTETYMVLKRQIQAKFKEVKEALLKRLQKCVA